jgi:peptidoglycan/xylan/chitin deacetylase (PgdA/CDA1 family)
LTDQELGATRIARWYGGAEAALMLLFDDSMPCHLENAIPALVKRGLMGTFYVNPGAEWFQPDRERWENEVPRTGMEYANHTMSHSGGSSAEEIEREIIECGEFIARFNPPSKTSPLKSYVTPGGVKEKRWPISDARLAALRKKLHLVTRPSTKGCVAGRDLNTAEEMFAQVEKALAEGSAEVVSYHGVGGGWISAARDEFEKFLDRLCAVRDRVWVAGHMPVHKYQTERDIARVEILQATGDDIRLKLTSEADPSLYDQPLTLMTSVPADWSACLVRQGEREKTVPVANGLVQYQALPGEVPVLLFALAR